MLYQLSYYRIIFVGKKQPDAPEESHVGNAKLCINFGMTKRF